MAVKMNMSDGKRKIAKVKGVHHFLQDFLQRNRYPEH